MPLIFQHSELATLPGLQQAELIGQTAQFSVAEVPARGAWQTNTRERALPWHSLAHITGCFNVCKSEFGIGESELSLKHTMSQEKEKTIHAFVSLFDTSD